MKKIIFFLPVILFSIITYLNSETLRNPGNNLKVIEPDSKQGNSIVNITVSNDFRVTVTGSFLNKSGNSYVTDFSRLKNFSVKNVKIGYKSIKPVKDTVLSFGTELSESSLLKYEPGKGESIYFSYEIIIDSSYYSYSSGFLHLENFLPEIKSDDNDYYLLKIQKPVKIKLCTSSLPVKESEIERVYKISQREVNELTLFASANLVEKKFVHDDIKVDLFIQEEREWYLERYQRIISLFADYFSEYFGEKPFNEISVIDLPHSVFRDGKIYPGIVTFSGKLLSPKEYLKPESDIIFGLSRQVFGQKIKFTKKDRWLELGLSEFFKNEFILEKTGNPKSSFKLAGYFPVPGINFIEYDEIPLIYTLGMYPFSPYVENMDNYYRFSRIAALSDTSFNYLNDQMRNAILKDKSALVLKTIENYTGKDEFKKIFNELYRSKKNKRFDLQSFYEQIKNVNREFFGFVKEELVKSSKYIDYSISSVRQKGKDITIVCNRLGEGILPCEIRVVAEKDTFDIKWNGVETWKEIKLVSRSEVKSAEIDPEGKNYLDINISNNSYTVDSNYFITFSLSLKWMFWVQNMLIILGLIG